MEQKKILIADDEEETLKILEKKLRENNYYVMAVSRGKDAIDMCKLDRPDLILLDIAMPDMDGYDVASELKNERTTKDIPIIFLTAKELDSRGINKRVGEIGAYDFIMKPCSIKELLDKIVSAIG